MVKKTAIAFLLLAVLTTEAVACPGCTYQRQLIENWHIKWIAINSLVPLIVVANRLDVVRFLYVLVPYVFLSFKFHSFLFWHTFGWRDSPLELFGAVAWWVWGLNLMGVALLYGISGLKFFRWNPHKALAWWQPLVYAALALILNMVLG